MLNLFHKKNFQNQAKKYTRILLFTLFIWFLLSPKITNILQSILYCITSSLIIFFIIGKQISHKMLKIITISFIFKKDFYKYFLYLSKEILKSTFHIFKTTIKMQKFQDEIITIPLPNNISTYRIFLITISTTLTPGTSVINFHNNILTIHCLTQNTKNSTQEMIFINKILSFKF